LPKFESTSANPIAVEPLGLSATVGHHAQSAFSGLLVGGKKDNSGTGSVWLYTENGGNEPISTMAYLVTAAPEP
jgi:hypothetical protein